MLGDVEEVVCAGRCRGGGVCWEAMGIQLFCKVEGKHDQPNCLSLLPPNLYLYPSLPYSYPSPPFTPPLPLPQQEDMDSMQKELETWRTENERHAEALRKEERYMYCSAGTETTVEFTWSVHYGIMFLSSQNN